MKTILLMIAAAVLFFVLVTGISVWEILKLKRRELQKKLEGHTGSKEPAASVMGESRTAHRQSLSIPAKTCKEDAKEDEGTKKPSTFAGGKDETGSGIVDIPDDELEEMDVDVLDEIPDFLNCFDEEPETLADRGVMTKELASLNRLLKKGRLADDEKEQLTGTVSKMEGTRLFDSIIEKFTRTTQGKLLEGLRQKVHEREMALSQPKNEAPVRIREGEEMSDEELKKYIQ